MSPPTWLSSVQGAFRLRALVILVILLGVIGLNAFTNERARSTGQEITLKTAPIDPRDVFFGHYATLGYDIAPRWGSPRLESFADDTFDGLFETDPISGIATGLVRSVSGVDMNDTREVTIHIAMVLREPFHEIALVSREKERADAAGTLTWSVNAVIEQDELTDRQKAAGDKPFRIFAQLNLPNRYYADPETALALQDLNMAARRAENEERADRNCLGDLRRTALAARNAEQQAANIVTRARSCGPVPEPKDWDNLADDYRDAMNAHYACLAEAVPEVVAEARTCQAPDLENAPEFGVILSIDEGRNPRIKGLYLNGERWYDSLAGPRLALERASDAET